MATTIGAVGGLIVVASIVAFDKIKIDDPVGAISVHGTVGIWGVMAVLFTNSDATFTGQIVGVVSIFAWAFLVSLAVWYVLKLIMGIRVSEGEELESLDVDKHGGHAYDLTGPPSILETVTGPTPAFSRRSTSLANEQA